MEITTGKKFETREAIVLEVSGQKIFAILHLPITEKKCPAVLFCHGYAGSKMGSQRMFVRMAEKMTQQGMIALRFDYRGSGDSEGDFQNMTLASEVEDTMAALEYLMSHPLVNGDKIGILGRSLGGVVAIKTAALFGKAKSVALWSPVFDASPWMGELDTFFQKTDGEITSAPVVKGHLSNTTFLNEFVNLQMEKELLDLSNIPLFLLHGEKDETVKITQSERYAMAREGAKAETELVLLPATDHYYCDISERNVILEKTYHWFQKTLS